MAARKYLQRQKANENLELRRGQMTLPVDALDAVFHTITEADVMAAKQK